tara:strand:+ start:222 stop:512 length:291 start_codon:yes stop_codon:yes gene_type:complete
MFWFIYIFSVLSFFYFITFHKKYKFSTPHFIFLIVLLTPAQLDAVSSVYSPALFSFFFNLTLERNLSLRLLRPLLLTIPISLLGYYLYFVIKKRFF